MAPGVSLGTATTLSRIGFHLWSSPARKSVNAANITTNA